jgi:hypothetical protein
MDALMHILRYMKVASGKEILVTINIDCRSIAIYIHVD